jgi:hypothetical protein
MTIMTQCPWLDEEGLINISEHGFHLLLNPRVEHPCLNIIGEADI